MRTATLSFITTLCLLLVVAPAMADTYDNGAPNFTTDAWTINFGFTVSDSFSLNNCFFSCSLTSLDIGVWLFPGDSVSSVQMDVGSTPFGSDFASGVLLTASGVTDFGINQYGYDTQIVHFDIDSIHANGDGWITLGNAVERVFGDPIYWDENSGPSSAYENTLGSIPSEAFTLTSYSCIGCVCGGVNNCVPEPSNIMLFGSGILGIVGVLRRRLNL